MTHEASGALFDGFTQPFGAINVGVGSQVLPRSEIPSDYNPVTRSYSDLTYYWQSSFADMVEMNSGVVYTGLPGSDPQTGQVGIPIEAQMPASYILELTPDLGKENLDDNFEPFILDQQVKSNPLLKQYTSLVVGSNVVSDIAYETPLKQKLAYTVPLIDMIELVNAEYSRYLWRVIPVAENGSNGFPSSVQYFEPKTIVSDSSWTIDRYDQKVNGITITMAGKKSPDVGNIEINGSTRNTSILSATEWSAEVPVHNVEEKLLVRAIDKKGTYSRYKILTVSINSSEQRYNQFFNTFDKFGYLLGLERIPKENNIDYKRRLLDVYKHRGGTTYLPLLDSVIRELDVPFDDNALVLKPHADFAKDYTNESISIAIDAKKISVSSSVFYVKHERHRIDPFDWTIQLKKDVVSPTIKIEAPIGNEIPNKNNWYSSSEKLYFRNNALADTPIFISYSYAESFLKKGKTVKDGADFITDISVNSVPLLSVTTGSTVDTGSTIDYMQKMSYTPIRDIVLTNDGGAEVVGLAIKWSECNIESLADDKYQSQFTNAHNNFFGTRINKYADNLSAKFKIQWGHAVADRSVWQTDKNLAISATYLPTNYDFTYGYWAQSNSGSTNVLSSNEAYAYNYVNVIDGSDLYYVGVEPSQLKSGIGSNTDLVVKINRKSTRVIPVFDSLQTNLIVTQSTAPADSAGNNPVNPPPITGEYATGIVTD
jgi:hypothetical protein